MDSPSIAAGVTAQDRPWIEKVIIALRYLPTDSLQEVLASTIGAREKKVSAQLQKWLGNMRIDVSGQTPRPASGTWGFPSIPFSGPTPSYFEMVAISIVVWLVLTAVLEYFRLRRRKAERRGPPASTSERGGAAAVAAASAAACLPSPSGRPAAGGQPPHRRGLLAGRPQWEGGQAREEIGSRAGGKAKMDGRLYCKIIRDYYLPFAESVFNGRYRFAQDPKHTSQLTSKHLDQYKIERLEWSPESPDLNPIEFVWHQLKHFRM
ncbi:hypothetical protein ANCDUO_03035 [Ancylostoma duodenale]|uniref:Tc1-like transposase DDE domain-containing protein n=1 Tax=Ancylostoma duodenale TaxID=51022 RepID=A0A0C2DUW3_9BILA|nr:hypothetical protein ANCDUO_03035 [Ancylostoma duodenale]